MSAQSLDYNLNTSSSEKTSKKAKTKEHQSNSLKWNVVRINVIQITAMTLKILTSVKFFGFVSKEKTLHLSPHKVAKTEQVKHLKNN